MATIAPAVDPQRVNLPVVETGALGTPEGLWGHGRNSLGIARLLHHEGRPPALVATACRTAVEYACRAALGAVGLRFEGDLEGGLRRLDVPLELLWDVDGAPDCGKRLVATERLLMWTARQMTRVAPDRRWVV